MDLSNNICSLCCSLQPRAVLGRLLPQDEFLSLMLGGIARSILACPGCRGRVDMFREWWLQWRENLGRLKQVQVEQKIFIEQQQPDTTSDSEGRVEISLTEASREDRPVQNPPNLITIMKVDISESKDKNSQTNSDDQYNIQNLPLNLVRRETQEKISNEYQCEPLVSILEENHEEAGPSLTSSYNLPVLIPSCSLQSKEGLDEPENERQPSNQTWVSQDERRKHRNREASRRYREKARGDPELLKKMREQQNKRQKKYYARLKDKKQVKRFSSNQSSLNSDN